MPINNESPVLRYLIAGGFTNYLEDYLIFLLAEKNNKTFSLVVQLVGVTNATSLVFILHSIMFKESHRNLKSVVLKLFRISNTTIKICHKGTGHLK